MERIRFKISTKIKAGFLTVFLFAIIPSCSDDFVDVEANQVLATEITEEDAIKLVNATYNTFLKWQVSSFSWIGITSIASDDADKGSDPGDSGADKDLLDALTHNSTTVSVAEVWEGHYEGIQRANRALNIIPQLENLDIALSSRLIGEAKFLRALLYFRLLQCYGGVPLISDSIDINSPDIILQLNQRATKEETFAFIEQDLQDAIAVLPEKSEYPISELGRATKGAAKTLLAKVSMYQNKWSEVLTLTNEIIASGEYALTPNYEDIWKEAFENNEESIFEIQGVAQSGNIGVDKYSVTQGARGEGGWGWGFNTPSEDLADSYEAGDTRRDATIIFRGETLFDGRVIPATVVNPMYNQKAYASAFTDDGFNGKNLRLLRYAEVLLMNAEAATQVGGDIAGPLNQVRSRAGLGSISSPTQLDVWNERRWELAFEHDRYFDLVRQGRAASVLQALGKPFEVGKHEVFPIPQTQIDLSGGVLQQNPNW